MCIEVYDRLQVGATTNQSQTEGEGLFSISIELDLHSTSFVGRTIEEDLAGLAVRIPNHAPATNSQALPRLTGISRSYRQGGPADARASEGGGDPTSKAARSRQPNNLNGNAGPPIGRCQESAAALKGLEDVPRLFVRLHENVVGVGVGYRRDQKATRYRPTRSLRTAIASRISVRTSAIGTFSATWRSTVIAAAASTRDAGSDLTVRSN